MSKDNDSYSILLYKDPKEFHHLTKLIFENKLFILDSDSKFSIFYLIKNKINSIERISISCHSDKKTRSCLITGCAILSKNSVVRVKGRITGRIRKLTNYHVSVFVKEEYRRQGVGSSLLTSLKQGIRSQIIFTPGIEGSKEFYHKNQILNQVSRHNKLF